MEYGKLWGTHKKLILGIASGLAVVGVTILSYFLILTSQPKHVTLAIDGSATTYETKAETVEEFLAEQNIALSDKDHITPSQLTPLTDELAITIQTSWEVPVHVDGQTKTVHTLKRDVAGILQDAGIALNSQDKVEPALTAAVSKGAAIRITRIDEKVVQVEEKVPFQEIRKNDPTLKKGETRVLQQGQEGKAVAHFKLITENGKEVSRELVKRDVISPKRDRIVAVGTRVVTAQQGKQTVTAAAMVSRGGKVFRPQRVLSNVTLTAYTPAGGGKPPGSPGYGRTATGVKATEGRTVAVDPRVIPLGWWVYIEGIGYRRAEDTGGAIKGNKIDVFFNSHTEAVRFGRKKVKNVYIIGPKLP